MGLWGGIIGGVVGLANNGINQLTGENDRQRAAQIAAAQIQANSTVALEAAKQKQTLYIGLAVVALIILGLAMYSKRNQHGVA